MEKNIGIFFGGRSSEREISLESGRHVYNNLDTSRYKRIPIFVDGQGYLWKIPEVLLWMNKTEDIVDNLSAAEQISFGKLPKLIDFAFLTLHGKYGEDCFPGLLRVLDIPNNSGGVLGGALSMDKFMQRKVLRASGLVVPDHFAIHYKQPLTDCEVRIQEIGFPLIVKPSREGCSLAITKVASRTDLEVALEEAFEYDNLVLLEEYLVGKEITTTVLGNENPYALLPTETPSKGSFLTVEEKFLPGDAKMITPPDLPQEVIETIQEQCVRAYKALDIKVFARIDGFWTEDERFVILEPNTIPGMTPSTCVFHQAAEEGMSPGDFFDKIIELGFSL
jgi:D-alanine-D-alanine ligase